MGGGGPMEPLLPKLGESGPLTPTIWAHLHIPAEFMNILNMKKKGY